MLRNNLKIIKEAYEALKPNEWRWKFDNDYRRKYEYVKEAATAPSSITRESLEYVADCALFLMEAHKRICK